MKIALFVVLARPLSVAVKASRPRPRARPHRSTPWIPRPKLNYIIAANADRESVMAVLEAENPYLCEAGIPRFESAMSVSMSTLCLSVNHDNWPFWNLVNLWNKDHWHTYTSRLRKSSIFFYGNIWKISRISLEYHDLMYRRTKAYSTFLILAFFSLSRSESREPEDFFLFRYDILLLKHHATRQTCKKFNRDEKADITTISKLSQPWIDVLNSMNYSYETEWKKYSTLIFMNYKNIVWNYFADLWCMKSKELVSMEVKDQYPIIIQLRRLSCIFLTASRRVYVQKQNNLCLW